MIVDDHPIVRYGIMHLLEAEPGMHIATDISNCFMAWEILRKNAPNLLLMDVELKDGCAHTLMMKIGEQGIDTRILVYSAQTEDWQILDALRHGAHGYITKNAEPDRLCEAVRMVGEGGFYIDPAIASKVIGQVGRIHERRSPRSRQLTPRESAVLKGIATGKRNQDIAAELYITERTVKYHLSSMFNKLQVQNRTEAVRYAFEHGMIKETPVLKKVLL